MAKPNKKKNSIVEPRVNDEIRGYDTARVIYSDSENGFNEIMSMGEIFAFAESVELDVIEVNPKMSPPIVKIADYSKYLFDLKKSLKNRNKNNISLKEVQLSTNISEHDLNTKENKAREFIKKGDKVKVVLTMRGRELSRRDMSKKCVFQFLDDLSDIAVPETMPRDEGNKCIVILKKK